MQCKSSAAHRPRTGHRAQRFNKGPQCLRGFDRILVSVCSLASVRGWTRVVCMRLHGRPACRLERWEDLGLLWVC